MSKAASAKAVHDAFSLSAENVATSKLRQTGNRNSTAAPRYKGRKLEHPRIVLIYWGSVWASAAKEASQAKSTAAINDLFTGPWSVELAQYRGIGPISLELVAQASHLDPPENFSNRWV